MAILRTTILLLAAVDGGGPSPRGEGGVFLRGDADGNRRLEITDAISSLAYLFLGGFSSDCLDALDATDDGRLDIADPVAALSFLFTGGAAPPPPFPQAGIDPTSDPFLCDGGPFASVRREVLAPSCSSGECHSRDAAAGGLALEGFLAYGQMVEVPARNEAARRQGLLLVKPGAPGESFLYRKIAGELGADEGASMADLGPPVSAEGLELVRRWIAEGALPSSPEDIALPPPPSGIQVIVPHFPVGEGEEVQRNHYFRLPNSGAVYVRRLEALYAPGGVHRNLYTSDAVSKPDGHHEDSFEGIPFIYWGLRASGQGRRIDWELPPGTAFRLSPFQQALTQTHFAGLGAGSSPIGGCGVINLHTETPSAPPFILGTLFIQNRNVILPPRSETTWEYGATLTRFRWNETVKVAAVSGHHHSRGISLEVRLWDGQSKNDDGSPRSGEFDRMGAASRILLGVPGEPDSFRTFGADGPELPRGWGIVYRAVFRNDTPWVIPFGPHAAAEEHANVLLHFYPGPEDGETFSFPLPIQS